MRAANKDRQRTQRGQNIPPVRGAVADHNLYRIGNLLRNHGYNLGHASAVNRAERRAVHVGFAPTITTP